MAYVLAIITVLVLAFSSIPFLKQSLPGRIARFIMGAGYAQQSIEDLNAELTRVDSLSACEWADQIMMDYINSHKTTEITPNSGLKQIPISLDKIPDWMPASWTKKNQNHYPMFLLQLDDAGKPLFIMCKWSIQGVIFAGSQTEKVPLEFSNFPVWEVRRVQQGVYVYFLYL